MRYAGVRALSGTISIGTPHNGGVLVPVIVMMLMISRMGGM